MVKQKVKDNDNDNVTYCSKCLKLIDTNDKDVVRDIDNNWFCDSECRQDYWRENRKLIEEIVTNEYN